MPELSDLPPYPLGEVLEVKKRRVEDAEKVVKEKKNAHEYDTGTTSVKIDQAKLYIKVVQERLKVEEKKVKDQQAQVETAEKNLELAKNQLRQRQKEQDKIEMHKKEWIKDTLKELSIMETREEDDLGSTMFLSKYMQNKTEAKKAAKREE